MLNILIYFEIFLILGNLSKCILNRKGLRYHYDGKEALYNIDIVE